MSDGSKVALGAVVGALVVLLLFGGFSDGMGHMMGGSMMGGGILGMLVSVVFWLLLLVLLVAAVVWFLGGTRRG
jgi:uncharacterized membrane protein